LEKEIDEEFSELPDPFLFHNTMMMSGSCLALVLVVGNSTMCA